jgi:hypothetical protein
MLAAEIRSSLFEKRPHPFDIFVPRSSLALQVSFEVELGVKGGA